jgi:hypothetical protein
MEILATVCSAAGHKNLLWTLLFSASSDDNTATHTAAASSNTVGQYVLLGWHQHKFFIQIQVLLRK